MKKICVVEHNGRFHPTIFCSAPKPSEYNDEVCRHYSQAHHTDGFSNYGEAVSWCLNTPDFEYNSTKLKWNSTDPINEMCVYL